MRPFLIKSEDNKNETCNVIIDLDRVESVRIFSENIEKKEGSCLLYYLCISMRSRDDWTASFIDEQRARQVAAEILGDEGIVNKLIIVRRKSGKELMRESLQE